MVPTRLYSHSKNHAMNHTGTATSKIGLQGKGMRVAMTRTPGAQDTATETPVTIPSHPLGIKPSGNAFAAKLNLRYSAGLFAKVPDEAIQRIFEFLNPSSNIQLGRTCKFLFAFAASEELWKSIFLEWQGTWRSTVLQPRNSRAVDVSCVGVFSDILYRPFQCAHTPLRPYVMGIPRRNEITRLDQLSYNEFWTSWATEPFILRGVVSKWPIFENWTINFLLSSYAEVSFRAEAVDWPLKDYINYMYHNNDESPLYLFDRCFVEKMDLKVAASGDAIGDYWTPSCFGEDFFSLLREDRPDSRWLIIGPERSGSTFHKDPNATSAWNAVIRGSKYWLLFPPHITPPGVFVSQDKSEVTSPLSISEYLLCFHAIARETPGCIEGVCGEGELVYVPPGWWHLVVNLDPTIALTQNFVSERGIGQALRFLKDHTDQASGFKEEVINPYNLFVKRLKDRWPTWSEEGVEPTRKRKWNEVVYGEIREARDSSFSFGFDTDSDEDLLN